MTPQANVLVYDLMIELLYNLEQLDYIPVEVIEEAKEEKIQEKLSILEENYLLGNHKEAFELAMELAEENCARAMYFIGEYYRFGYGQVVERDAKKGFEWHKRGAELGEALCKLQLSYQYGHDSDERNNIQQEVFKTLQKLSEEGDPIVQSEFADICGDAEEKEKWLEKASKKGHWNAMCKLGKNYYGKNRAAYDYFLAIYYFMKAKERNCADAIGYLGLMYDWGYGFQEDKEEAFEWYEIAAEGGSDFSMRNLADAYYSGLGCSKNYEDAKKWYKKAAELGLEDAKRKLKWKFGIEV